MALSKKCLRYLTLTYDVIFAVSALSFVCFNSFILFNILKFKTLIHMSTTTPVIVNIVVGFLYILISWCGWRVAFKVNALHLKLYGAFLVVMIIAKICCIAWIIHILHNTLKVDVTKNTEAQFALATETDEPAKALWDKIQTNLQCCGIGGPTDYRKSSSVPWSCCKRAASDVSGDCTSVHQHGCLLDIYDEVYRNLVYSMISCLGMIVIQAIGVAAYFSLNKAIQPSKNLSLLTPNQSPPTCTSIDYPALTSTEASQSLLHSPTSPPPKY
ncbi:23 kDa integral membrane protein-like [Arctopsyche grandis]|uniref:23 kDa integral membrane protein-like n=1 Tax=Arctopsyche grandis TaxID=121162 RepID=UPI00406D8DEA